MGNARLTPFSLPRAQSKLAPGKGETLLKNRRASSNLQRIGNNYMTTGFAEDVMGDRQGFFLCVKRAPFFPPPPILKVYAKGA